MKKIKIRYKTPVLDIDKMQKDGFDESKLKGKTKQEIFQLYEKYILFSSDSSKFSADIEIVDLHQLGIAKIDFNQFINFPNLKEIVLGYNRFLGLFEPLDLSPLSNCKNLEVLILEQNYISKIDLTPLGSCPKFDGITFRMNVLEEIDLTPFGNCPKFRVLEMPWNRLKYVDLSPFSKCPNFSHLAIDLNNLQEIDLSPLSKCTNLEILYLNNNQLKEIDLSPLAKCTKLNQLLLDKNLYDFIDLRPLASCTNLERVDIDDVEREIPKGNIDWLSVRERQKGGP